MKIKCVCECVCVNLVDVVCAIGMYELIVLSPGGGVILTRQTVQIVPEPCLIKSLLYQWRDL